LSRVQHSPQSSLHFVLNVEALWQLVEYAEMGGGVGEGEVRGSVINH